MALARKTSRIKSSAPKPEFWDMNEVRFRRIVTLLIAGVAFLGTVTAALRVESSARAATADRDGRAFIIKAVGKGNAGTQRYTLERNMMAEFQTLVTQGSVDLRLAEDSLSRGEALAHLQDSARLDLVRENLRRFSTLLSPPYYDPKSGAIDVLRFGVDYMVAPPVRWTEMQRTKSEEASAWSTKSDGYIVIITILAVCLFLLGLSLTLGGRLKFVFAGLGCFIGAVAVLGILVTAVSGVPKTSEEAIRSYVNGAGQLYHAGMLALAGGDTAQSEAEVVRHADQAIASFCQALFIKDDYTAARRALGETHLLVGQTLLFSRDGSADPDQARGEIALALDSLSKAAQRGNADIRVYRDLGWARFLAGEYGAAVTAWETAFKLAPEFELDMGLNIALGLIAEGRAAAGFDRMERAVSRAQSHPLASDAFSFRAMIHNLDRLMDVRPLVGLDRMRKRLKEAFVSISFRKTSVVKQTAATISPLKFFLPGGVDQGLVSDHDGIVEFPSGTSRVDFAFDHAKLPRGCQVVQKVSWQGKEAAWLTRVFNWTGSEVGRAAWSIRAPVAGAMAGLIAGRYSVDLYVDGNLLRTGEFEISSK